MECSSQAGSSLLSNVSMDASLDLDTDEQQPWDTCSDSVSGSVKYVDSFAGSGAAESAWQQSRTPIADTVYCSKPSASYTVEPLQPARLRPAKEKSNVDSKQLESGETSEKRRVAGPAVNDVDADSDCTTPSDGYKTPSTGTSPQREVPPQSSKFSYDTQMSCPAEVSRSYVVNRSANYSGNFSNQYESHDRLLNPEMDSATDLSSVVSDGSDDAELHKLRNDANNRESGQAVTDHVKQLRDQVPRTSFAKLRKWKEKNSGSVDTPVIYEQQENSTGPSLMSKSALLAHPAQMTWMEAARIQRSTSERNIAHAVEKMPESRVMQPQTAGLRMKLEERRRQIENEKRRNEQQRNQKLHQIGQEAFVQVIRKNDKRAARRDEKSVSQNAVTVEPSVPVSQIADTTIADSRLPLSETHRENEDSRLRTRKALHNVTSVDAVDNSLDLNISGNNVTPFLASSKSASAHDSSRKTQTSPATSIVRSPLEVNRSASVRMDTHSVASSAVRHPSVGLQQPILSDNVRRSISTTQSEGGENVSASASRHLITRTLNVNSFDRISSSLSDLQAELSRLNARQDELKNLVSSGAVGPTGAVSTAGERDRFFMHPPTDPAGRKTPDLYARPPHTGPGEAYVPDMMVPRQPYPPVPGYDVDPRVYIPPYGPYGPPPYVSQPRVGLHGAYPTAIPPVMHPYPVTTAYMPPYQPPHGAMYGQYHQHPYPADVGPWLNPEEATFYLPSPTTGMHVQKSNVQEEHVKLPDSTAAETVPDTVESPVEQTSEVDSATEKSALGLPCETSGSVPVTQPTAFFVDALPQQNIHTASHQNYSSSTLTTPRSEGFFVSFDPKSVNTEIDELKSAPLNNASYTVVASPECTNTPISSETVSSAEHSPNVVQSDVNQNAATPPVSESDTSSAAIASQPMVFIIGQEETGEDQAEMERRRLRLQEQQAKRRDEQEQKRLIIEMEVNRKREAQKLKTEEEERKRMEEKARRDAIFEKYIRRKMAVEGTVETDVQPPSGTKSKTPESAHVVLRKKRPSRHGSARPLSQPPPASNYATPPGLGKPAFDDGHRFASHASDDNLLSVEEIGLTAHSSDHLDAAPEVQDNTRLLRGGLTHRRPSSPDRSPAAQPDSGSSTNSLHQDYAGPKLYVKPSQKSNRSIIINAISHCCLAGVVNKELKEKVLEKPEVNFPKTFQMRSVDLNHFITETFEIARSTAVQFVILFRDAGMQYRGLYVFNPDDTTPGGEVILTKIHGTGPRQLSSKVMEKFFKYNSGAKTFSEVKSTKHLTATIDAVTVLSSVWQKNRAVNMPPTPSGKKPV